MDPRPSALVSTSCRPRSLKPRAGSPLPLDATVDGSDLRIEFGAAQSPGLDYRLAGEVEDPRGNRTRFLVKFVGWYDRFPNAPVRAQNRKNSSKLNPHRDYIESRSSRTEPGRDGAEMVKLGQGGVLIGFRDRGLAGDFIVLHVAPEGSRPRSTNWPGTDMSAASTRRRRAGPLVVGGAAARRERRRRPAKEAGRPLRRRVFLRRRRKDGLVARTSCRSRIRAGALGRVAFSRPGSGVERRFSLASLVLALAVPHRGEKGPASWFVTASSGQSPGSANPAP